MCRPPFQCISASLRSIRTNSQQRSILLLRVERTETLALRGGEERNTKWQRQIQRKMDMAARIPVEIDLTQSTPIYLAVIWGLHLNYQVAFPKKILLPMGELLWKICSNGSANDTNKWLGEQEMGESCVSAYSSRLHGQEKLEQGERWWVPKCKGQVCRNAEPEKTKKTRRMLEQDLGKWSIACGNSGLQGKDSMEAKTGDLPDLRKQRGTIKTSKDAVTNKELSSKCGSSPCSPLYFPATFLRVYLEQDSPGDW